MVTTKIICTSSYMRYLPAFLVLTKKKTGSGDEIARQKAVSIIRAL